MSSKKQKIIVGIDVDGVLRDFEAKVIEVVTQIYPEDSTSDVFSPGVVDKYKHIWQNSHVKEVFRDAEPLPGALDGMKAISKVHKRVQTVCVTQQMPFLAHHTLYWLGLHGFNFQKVYISQNKPSEPIDFLIDDMEKQYNKWQAAGRDMDHFILMHDKRNAHIDAIHRINRLNEACPIIEKYL